MVAIISGEAKINAKPGEKIALKPSPALGSPLYAIVRKKDGSEEVVEHPFVVGDDWEEARVLYYGDDDGKEMLLDMLAHVLQAAVKSIFPHYLLAGHEVRGDEARVDFYTYNKPFTSEELDAIRARAEELASRMRVSASVMSRDEALKVIADWGEPLLYEQVYSGEWKSVALIEMNGFRTVCPRTLHPPSASAVSIIRITNTSMVHWMGEEKGLRLYRIHATCFPSIEDEKLYLEWRRQVELRDHVLLGKEMDLFLTSPLIGAGLILWTPNGARMRRVLEEYVYKLHIMRGYQPVVTPHVASGELFKTSGHLQHFRENMFLFEIEGRLHAIKPMNCPFHIMILKRKKYSYRDLPVRYFELGTVYRYERAGTLHGLTRVRGLTQDDAHIFLREDQIESEILGVLELIREMYSSFGIRNYRFKLSVRGEDKEGYMGSPEVWEKAEEALEKALRKHGISFVKEEGEAAFYGPKIDVYLKDSLGREWQCGTIQLDFNLPERFDLTYTDADNKERRMVMIHRAVLGSIERFLGVLMEYYAGRLPLWLAPIQAVVLPVEESSAEQHEYARKVHEHLLNAGVRAELLVEGRLNGRLRKARKMRVPLIIVVGRREVKSGSLSVTMIRYGEDEKGMYKPVEEKTSFSSPQELVDWIRKEVERQTNGVIKLQ